MALKKGLIRKTLEFLRGRRTAYVRTFMSPVGQQVLHDLAKFCRGGETCFDPDPRIHAALEGRREVWLRITNHLHLNSEQLFVLYNGGTINTEKEQDDA